MSKLKANSHHVYSFKEFTLDLKRGCLLHEGREVKLRPKVFEALKYLVENSGRLVTKAELIQAVWSDAFVTDDSLVQCLVELRRALGDEAQRCIKTVPRRGYIFVAEVKQTGPSTPGVIYAEHIEGVRVVVEQEEETESRAGQVVPRLAAKASGERPETKYARSGDVSIAYMVMGDGPLDLVYVPGWVTHLEYAWEEPSLARYYRRLASVSRLILFDKRGTGLSDKTANPPTLEERMDDVRAVMDAVGSERAALFGASEGGNMSILFAATYPDRTTALITCGVYAKRIWDPEYPWAPTPEVRQKWFDSIQQEWGGIHDLLNLAPGVGDDERFQRWWATYLRRSVSPGAALAFGQANTQIDVRHILPAIRVPTLVLHRAGDLEVKVEEGRYIASRIPGAKYVEIPGDDHLPWVGDQDAILREVEAFLTSIRPVPNLDRVLTTVMFAHVVAPSARAGEIEEHRRQDLLKQYRALVRSNLARFRGREIETNGERLLATFDGPARAIRAASAIVDAARRLGLEVKAGLHTGECDLVGDKLGGVALEIARQVTAQARPGELLVSSTVKDLVAGSGTSFQDRGAHVVEGVEGAWRLFAVKRDGDPQTTDVVQSAQHRRSTRSR